MENTIFKFWAKTSHDKNHPNAYHPLFCHLIDVATVTRLMWHEVLPVALQNRVQRELGLDDSEDSKKLTESFISFIAGLHDLGKCSPPFALRQTKQNIKAIYDEAADGKFSETAYLKRFPFGLPAPQEAPHGFVTAAELPRILANEFGLRKDEETPSKLAKLIAEIIGGHHGIFGKDIAELRKEERKTGGKAWKEARRQLTLELARILDLPRPLPIPPTANFSNATTMLLAGLVSVADWIGSNTSYFSCEVADSTADLLPNLTADNYAKKSETNAREALRQLGWLDWQTPKTELKFAEMFPKLTKFPSRDLQTQSVKLAEKLDSPGIVVIESPTGEGKTEAAIYLADRWNYQLKQRGVYFALPTQATSDQMFGRVVEYLKVRFPDSNPQIQLLHGHSALSTDFQTVLQDGAKVLNQQNISDDGEYSYDDCTPAVIASQWFTGRKKGLLAPVGVGTIDQALLAVLQTKHVFVRLFGLAHKTVIIDEVHAYDAYMSTLLERLLEWLAALGSPVILLSATLPRKRRAALIEAYQKGLGRIESTLEVAEYPRLSWATAENVGAVGLQTSTLNQRVLQFQNLDGFLTDDAKIEKLAEELKTALQNGGCAAVICNTVGRAQEIYQTLKNYLTDLGNFSADERFWTKDEIELLHARFLYKDRQSREKHALVKFGKEGEEIRLTEIVDGEEISEKVERPHRAILVSTQIIEQSLDLDFDLIITDLAPVDLILQRAGRLHRHAGRTRPANLENPMLWILQPEIKDGVPDFGVSAWVYDEHILLRSWLELKKLEEHQIRVPDNVENLIEMVYSDDCICPADATTEIADFWQTSRQEYDKQFAEDKAQAARRWLKRPSDQTQLWCFTENFYAEDSPELHKSFQALTRLAEPSVSVVCVYGTLDRAFLDVEERASINLKKPPLPVVRQLLFNSVTISGWRFVAPLQNTEATEPPASWKDSPMLRNSRLLLLDENGSAEVGEYVFRIDKEFGVIAQKKNEKLNLEEETKL